MRYMTIVLLLLSVSTVEASSSVAFQGFTIENGRSWALLEIQGEQDLFSLGAQVADLGTLESITKSSVTIKLEDGKKLRLNIWGDIKEFGSDTEPGLNEEHSLDSLLARHTDDNATLHLDQSSSSRILVEGGLQDGDVLVSSVATAGARIFTLQRGAISHEIIVAAS